MAGTFNTELKIINRMMKKLLFSTAIALIAGFSANANDYYKVTSIDEITYGNYLIACPAKGKVMGAISNGSFPAVTVPDLTTDTEIITGSEEYAVVRITPIEGTDYYTFKIDGKYLTRTNGLTLSDEVAYTAFNAANLRIYPGSDSASGNFMIYNSGTQAFSTANRANNTSQFAVSCLELFKDEEVPEPEDSIAEINAEVTAATEWYNLQGMRIAAPAKGGVYLRVTSAGVEKVLVR